MSPSAISFNNGVSLIRAMHHTGKFSVELETDNDAVTYTVIWPAREGETCDTRMTMPQASNMHPYAQEMVFGLIDQWFKECPDETVSLALVRELLKVRAAFHGAWMESL